MNPLRPVWLKFLRHAGLLCLLATVATVLRADDVPANIPEAMRPVYAKALAKDVPSVLQIADMYLLAQGVPRNDSEARRLLLTVYAQVEVKEKLAWIAHRGRDGARPDLSEEIDWLMAAADQGSARAKALLAEYAAAKPEAAFLIKSQPARHEYRGLHRLAASADRIALVARFTASMAQTGRELGFTKAQICDQVMNEMQARLEMSLTEAGAYVMAINDGAYDLPTLRSRMNPQVTQQVQAYAQRVGHNLSRPAGAAAPAAQSAAAPAWSRTRSIGERHGDGIIVYVDGTGQHGLILSLSERGSGKPADGGARPTAFDPQTGLTSWYLPSLDEWKYVTAERRRIESALAQANGHPLGKNGHYWTATTKLYRVSANGPITTHYWCYLPANGDQRDSNPANILAAVRTVRQF